MPQRGNPPADGDVATAFTVFGARPIEVRELVVAVARRTGSGLFAASVHEDEDGSPATVIVSFLSHAESRPATLRIPVTQKLLLEPESRYWVSISVDEPDAEVAWFGSAPQVDEMWTRIAERFDQGEWRAGDTRGGMALRVTGVPA
jgi:hypothetical protein